MRKILIYIAMIFFLGIGLYFFYLDHGQKHWSRDDCPFCDTATIEMQKFYETDEAMALCTYKPMLPGHFLVIPKRHVERLDRLSKQEMAEVGEIFTMVNSAVEKVYGTSSYLILQKNGAEVGQTVPHVHFHYIPRKAGDQSTLGFLYKMFIANLKKPISLEKRKQIVLQMKSALQEIKTQE